MIQKYKINIVIDGQWGSTGKGKLYGYLYNKYPFISVAVCDFMPNAAHTYVDDNGNKFVSKIMPIGSLFENVKLVCIGPHSVFNKEELFKEYEEVLKWRKSKFELAIHPLATVIDSKDIDNEKIFSCISSTMQGGCSSVIRKMMRSKKDCNIVKNHKDLRKYIQNTQDLIQFKVWADATVLCESAQGFGLGLNTGQYPYVTSRDCLIGRILDNAGGHPKTMGSVIASLRTYPIRVGNTLNGWSGPYFTDQDEISWGDISKNIGYEVEEKTTITKRVRRVFTFSHIQISRFLNYCMPDYAFLNFVNYWPEHLRNKRIEVMRSSLSAYNCKLALLGTGPRNCDMIEI